MENGNSRDMEGKDGGLMSNKKGKGTLSRIGYGDGGEIF